MRVHGCWGEPEAPSVVHTVTGKFFMLLKAAIMNLIVSYALKTTQKHEKKIRDDDNTKSNMKVERRG